MTGLPIFKWDARFSGNGHKYSLTELIYRVERFANDDNIPHTNYFQISTVY